MSYWVCHGNHMLRVTQRDLPILTLNVHTYCISVYIYTMYTLSCLFFKYTAWHLKKKVLSIVS